MLTCRVSYRSAYSIFISPTFISPTFTFVFECRRCRDHEELKNEVVALRQRVRELEGEKSSVGVQTEASDDVKRDDGTLREVGGGGEVGQVGQVEQVEQAEQVEQVEQVA